MSSDSPRIVRVGIIGCGTVAQVVHLPTLSLLCHLFRITYLCDVSENALRHCQARVVGGVPPEITTDAAELCASPEVDVVFVINSDEYHTDHAVLALQHNKFVFVEKPLALNLRDCEAIASAEKASSGDVMVGYMRRYAPVFLDAVKEIGGVENIMFARVRDIIGPNSTFIEQSGTFAKAFTDFPPESTKEKDAKAEDTVSQGLKECGVKMTPESTMTWRIMGGLGSHDLSAMRECIGLPDEVLGSSLALPFWSVLFQYPKFAVSYETGFYNVPKFDAHIEVYGQNKSVRVQYDTPFVKGLPITMHISEVCDGGSLKETTIRKTYEDPYTVELKELYAHITEGRPIKTTISDAKEDLEIFKMIVQKGHERT
ncbi:unnamed protein product [Clonostachys byssicola]|uniref:Gfo/Idh/MocA-like oxidoreductase N-terminal domain-containing protein n=1 Tax=Clonostachys byssicola TaxID=160290 RepID=A0A9N9U601_9HYPO|nr:unnamed protein product [Clonostachys byssicola]